MNKNESKYFNTAVKFDKALLSLLDKKPFEYITISEICKEAGVNRSTFYLHYENTCDLLNETGKYILDNFLSYFSLETKHIVYRFDGCTLNELVFVTPKYLNPYLSFIKDNQYIFRISLHHIDTMNFNEVYQRMFTHIFSPILSRFNFPEKDHHYVMKFYLSGIIAIIIEWLDNSCTTDIDEIAQIIIDCTIGNDPNFSFIASNIKQ